MLYLGVLLLVKHRNINLDLMRFLGILIIMIAHASPPEWLFQLRNFGTPLLIVISALTYAEVYSERQIDLSTFYKKRLARLIIPAWIFLTFYFFMIFVASEFLHRNYPFSPQKILESYTFYKGIGFVWIFKVYIILALLTPFSLKVSTLKTSNTKYFLFLLVLYIAYEYALMTLAPYIPQKLEGFFYTVFYIVVPYLILYLYGMRLGSFTNKQIIYVIITSFFLFILLTSAKYIESGHFVPTQNFKYPPTIYYLSYAFFALNLVYLICRNLLIFDKNIKSTIVWLSSNSLWIYLWHIMALFLWGFLIGSITESFLGFLAKVCFILTFGIIMTHIQVFIVKKVASKDHYIGRKAIALLT